MPEKRPDPTVPETGRTAPPRGAITVRYWASARAAAGRVEDTVHDVRTVQQALDAVRAQRPGDDRFARVLAISSVLLGDRPVGKESYAAVQLAPGDMVEVLPPFAGG